MLRGQAEEKIQRAILDGLRGCLERRGRSDVGETKTVLETSAPGRVPQLGNAAPARPVPTLSRGLCIAGAVPNF